MEQFNYLKSSIKEKKDFFLSQINNIEFEVLTIYLFNQFVKKLNTGLSEKHFSLQIYKDIFLETQTCSTNYPGEEQISYYEMIMSSEKVNTKLKQCLKVINNLETFIPSTSEKDFILKTRQLRISAEKKSFQNLIEKYNKKTEEYKQVNCSQIVNSMIEDLHKHKIEYPSFSRDSVHGFGSISDISMEILSVLESNQNVLKNRINTGYTEIDDLLGGMEQGTVHIIAGRPSTGKTLMMMNIVANILKNNVECLVISLESSHITLTANLLSIYSEMQRSSVLKPNTMITNKDVNDVVRGIENLKTKPLYFVFNTTYTIEDIESVISDHVKRFNVRIVCIDYIQLVRSNKYFAGGAVPELSYISQKSKQIAATYNVVILLFAQLHREIDKRDSNEPQLSDLKGTSDLEQVAESVIFLHRDEYHKEQMYNQAKYSKKSKKDTLKLILKKNRNGRCGSVVLNIDLNTLKVSETSDKNKNDDGENDNKPNVNDIYDF